MRPVTVTVGPLAAGVANNIATSQSPAGTTGNAAATFTASSASIVATNTLIAGQAVQFTPVGANLPSNIVPYSTYFVSATGLSGAHFQVSTAPGGASVVPATSGTGNAVWGATVALNGTKVNSAGVAVLDNARRVLITTADTTTKFTINGTDAGGNPISETFVVAGGVTYSNLDYLTVTSITVNQAPTAALTVGTNGIASSPWVRFDEYAPGPVSIQCNVVGTVNYTIQGTMDDPNSPTNAVVPASVTWIQTSDTAGQGATGSIQSNYEFPPIFARILLNSGTGSVTATFSQIGAVPY